MKKDENLIEQKVQKECGLYLRVSTERQAQIKEGSLDTQLGTLKKFCEIKSSHGTEEWVVAEVYREEGKSGKNTDRPEYKRMIQDIKQGRLNAVLCTKIDRIHRSLVDFYRLHELLEKHNVAFVSLNENWDTSTPMGRFGLKLTLAVAELEREQTSQRTREKLQWRAEEGLWNGGQLLGYDIDPDNKGILKANPTEARIIREIFETYLKLGSFRRTAQAINDKGYRSKVYESRRGHMHGNNKFIKQGIIHILSNPVYIGKVTHKGETFPAKHQPILDEKLWNAVHARASANRVVRAKPRQQKMHCFLLEGIVRCGVCGAYMTPSYSGGRNEVYFYYTCTSAHNGADECGLKRVSAQALEDLIAERLKMMARDEAFVKQILEESNLCAKDEMAIIDEQRETQKRALAPIVQEITNIVRFIAQGRASDALARELERLEVQKVQIEGELERIGLDAREIANRTLNAQAIQEGLGLFEEIWENATPDERKELMRFFVYKVIFTPTEVKMGLYTRPIFAEQAESTVTGNHTGVGAVDRMYWLPKCNSIRSRPGWVEPEVYFRIVHLAQNGPNSVPVAAYREQMVEIALGPKGAFENGNIGALTRRAPPGQVVSAVLPGRDGPKPPREPKTPRVVELLRKAIEWKALLESGEIANQAEIACQEGITRARVTQVMGMLRLAPMIQEQVLSMPNIVCRPPISERMLRPISAITDCNDQVREFQRFLA